MMKLQTSEMQQNPHFPKAVGNNSIQWTFSSAWLLVVTTGRHRTRQFSLTMSQRAAPRNDRDNLEPTDPRQSMSLG